MKDEEFFARVEKIRAKMYRIAYPYFNSESMTIDIVDEAIYRGYLKKRQLKNEEYMETWLIRILINQCKTKYEKSKKHTNLDEINEKSIASDIENLPLHEAIERLSEEYKKPIILKYFGGYTTVEIAKILDIPQGTVATRVRKALELLKLELEE